jgi:hypothetical protein
MLEFEKEKKLKFIYLLFFMKLDLVRIILKFKRKLGL